MYSCQGQSKEIKKSVWVVNSHIFSVQQKLNGNDKLGKTEIKKFILVFLCRFSLSNQMK